MISSKNSFLNDVVLGLSSKPKRLPCKYLYDKRGSELFDKICKLDEYYLTRTELVIMRENVLEMLEFVGPRCILIEFGSGSSLKTRLLIEELKQPAAYIPVDISRQHLDQAVQSLSSEFPSLPIVPLSSDFTGEIILPGYFENAAKRVVFFPGSTIGNFTVDEAVNLLRKISALVGVGGGLLIGVDLVKSSEVLESAYNDSEGITAQFNLNILTRMQGELQAEVMLDQFRHRAFYNQIKERIEMHLLSLADQVIIIGDHVFELREGETMHTENSHKYRLEQFAEMAHLAGLVRREVWTDVDGLFSVQFFEVT